MVIRFWNSWCVRSFLDIHIDGSSVNQIMFAYGKIHTWYEITPKFEVQFRGCQWNQATTKLQPAIPGVLQIRLELRVKNSVKTVPKYTAWNHWNDWFANPTSLFWVKQFFGLTTAHFGKIWSSLQQVGIKGGHHYFPYSIVNLFNSQR
jgi:hypothetical protein